MSAKITIVLLLACAVIALAGGKGDRDNGHAFKTAQFCIQQYDNPGEPRIYC